MDSLPMINQWKGQGGISDHSPVLLHIREVASKLVVGVEFCNVDIRFSDLFRRKDPIIV